MAHHDEAADLTEVVEALGGVVVQDVDVVGDRLLRPDDVLGPLREHHEGLAGGEPRLEADGPPHLQDVLLLGKGAVGECLANHRDGALVGCGDVDLCSHMETREQVPHEFRPQGGVHMQRGGFPARRDRHRPAQDQRLVFRA